MEKIPIHDSVGVQLTKFSSLNESQRSKKGEKVRKHKQQSRVENWDGNSKRSGSKFNEESPIKNTRQLITPSPDGANLEEATCGDFAREPFQVVWSNLTFQVDAKINNQPFGPALDRVRSLFSSKKCRDESPSHCQSSKRVIFENLNGHIKSGEISAILGPSGAGKTSLLNAICSQSNAANYRGQVKVVGGGTSRMRVSVIPQKDCLIDRLTVKENLLFGSKILNHHKDFDHEANIMRLAKMLNLVDCLNSSTSKISGGEHKRLSIAQELLNRPDILILDEPTSGLDSVSCKNLIKSLKSLVDSSRRGIIDRIAIVLTIHQPDAEIFQMFDHIYCMARGGRTIYEGHPSKALEVVLSHSGLDKSVLTRFAGINPANLLIEIASDLVYGPDPVEKLNKLQLQQFKRKRIDLLDSSLQILDTNGYRDQFHESSAMGCSNAAFIEENSTSTKDSNSFQESQRSTTRAASPGLSLFTAHSCTPLNSTPSPVSSPCPSVSSAINELDRKSTSPTGSLNGDRFLRDKRLIPKLDHSGKFWRQLWLLAKRNSIATLRDPSLTLVAIGFHLLIPFVMWVTYSKNIGKVNACPMIYREIEVVALAGEEPEVRLAELMENLVTSLECLAMFFISLYCFSLRSLALAALSFPLDVQVLIKESRNGWYKATPYVMGRILSGLLLEVLLPIISIILIYFLMEMPYSPYHWRLWAISLVTALVSLISFVQGLIWGVINMDSVQTAVMMGVCSTLPPLFVSGFTGRIKIMPVFMQNISLFSFYRLACDAINMIRFGFGMCPCDASTEQYLKTKSPTFVDLPPTLKEMVKFHLSNYADGAEESLSDSDGTMVWQATSIVQDLFLNSTARGVMLQDMDENKLDIFNRVAEFMARPFVYGREMHGCESVRSQRLVVEGTPTDDYLPAMYGGLAIMFIVSSLLLLIIVNFRISKRV